MMNASFPGILFLVLTGFVAGAADNLTQAEVSSSTLKDWPAGVREIRYRSDADQTEQPALFYAPEGQRPVPLIVALHSWSGNYRQASQAPVARWAIARGWVFIHPDFRGPNRRPEACGSELMVRDILSAVAYARAAATVDPARIYLVGGSGGGHATLLLAGRAPEVWTAVSAWCPITDLVAWHAESVVRKQKYARDIELSVGGAPAPGTPAEAEARKRSPLAYLSAARRLPVSIHVGIHDGHTGSVPVSHSLRAFNMLAAPEDRLSEEQIRWFTEKRAVPTELAAQREDDSTYGKKTVLFRRRSQNVTLTVFDGGHEILFEPALAWLEQQHKR
jgi:dienelactone hydrolase